MLVRKFLDDLGPALGIGAVILGDDLDGPPIDAARIVDGLSRGGRGAAVPASVGGADAGGVLLEADLDRSRRLRLSETRRQWQGGDRRQGW